jgi:hypothetical protein
VCVCVHTRFGTNTMVMATRPVAIVAYRGSPPVVPVVECVLAQHCWDAAYNEAQWALAYEQ